MSARVSEGAYEPIAFGFGWSTISWVSFLLALEVRPFLRLLPWRPTHAWMWPLWMVVGMAILSTLGILTGLAGWRFRRSTPARWGMFVNAVVFGIVALVFLAMVYIRYLR